MEALTDREPVETRTEDGDRFMLERTAEGYFTETHVESGVERISHPAGFKASFDLTRVWGRDVWRDLMDMFDLQETEAPRRHGSSRFVYYGEDLAITTTCNPFTGEHCRRDGKEWNPEDRLAYCGYIHIIGEVQAVTKAYNHIKENSNSKASSLGRWIV